MFANMTNTLIVEKRGGYTAQDTPSTRLRKGVSDGRTHLV